MSKLDKSTIYGAELLDSVIIEEYLDNPKGKLETVITIHFKDGAVKCLSFTQEL